MSPSLSMTNVCFKYKVSARHILEKVISPQIILKRKGDLAVYVLRHFSVLILKLWMDCLTQYELSSYSWLCSFFLILRENMSFNYRYSLEIGSSLVYIVVTLYMKVCKFLDMHDFFYMDGWKIFWYHENYILITSNVGKNIPFFKKEVSLSSVSCT
jgi:hypothetical protein